MLFAILFSARFISSRTKTQDGLLRNFLVFNSTWGSWFATTLNTIECNNRNNITICSGTHAGRAFAAPVPILFMSQGSNNDQTFQTNGLCTVNLRSCLGSRGPLQHVANRNNEIEHSTISLFCVKRSGNCSFRIVTVFRSQVTQYEPVCVHAQTDIDIHTYPRHSRGCPSAILNLILLYQLLESVTFSIAVPSSTLSP